MAVMETGENHAHAFPHGQLEGCLSTAAELVSLLEDEGAVLKSFDGDRLLQLLPRKEFLVNDLYRRLRTLESGGTGSGVAHGVSGEDRVAELKNLLKTIESLNGFNRIFIQQSLSHWRQFMAAVDHSGYGPRQGAAGTALLHKGFNFRGEA